MNGNASKPVVILDANVLFSFRKRDILLRFHQAGIFRARWSKQIIDAWTRNLLDLHPKFNESIQSQLLAMQQHFPDALVTGFEQIVETLDLPDENDRHVLAAAIQCDAQHIVTDNIVDFPAQKLTPYGIVAMMSDEFLERMFDLDRAKALAVLRKLRADYKNPAYSPSELVMDLTAKGLPKMAALVRQHRRIL